MEAMTMKMAELLSLMASWRPSNPASIMAVWRLNLGFHGRVDGVDGRINLDALSCPRK